MNLEPHVAGDGIVFADSFWSPATVQAQNGVIVASTISKGISPTGATGRVTYGGTESLLINATQMTVAMRFKMFSVDNVAAKGFLGKNTLALTDNQFFVQINPPGRNLSLYVSSSAADTANYVYITTAMTLGAEATVHFVYNGGLAVGSRGAAYLNGLTTTSAIVGTLPATMRASASPFSVLSVWGNAPDNDFILRNFRIFNFAMSAAEVSDDYYDLTNRELTP